MSIKQKPVPYTEVLSETDYSTIQVGCTERGSILISNPEAGGSIIVMDRAQFDKMVAIVRGEVVSP